MPRRVTHAVPLLGAGRHTHPRHGGCLVELAGSLIGGPWSDRPASLDPVLGHLLRTVNDRCGADERPALAQLTPWLADLRPGHDRPGRDRFDHGVVPTAVTKAALPLVRSSALRRALVLAGPGADGPRSGEPLRFGPGWCGHRAAIQFVTSAVRVVREDRGDAGLRHLLVGTLTELRLHSGLPPMPAMDRAARHCRLAVPVVGEIRAPGGDGMHQYWTADVEGWPHWMRTADTNNTSLIEFSSH
jgi:hypothetical protein